MIEEFRNGLKIKFDNPNQAEIIFEIIKSL
jgi:hypothetical protein